MITSKYVLSTAMLLGLLIGCAKNQDSNQEKTNPIAAPNESKQEVETPKNINLTCSTINFLVGGLESAGGDKVLALSSQDENRTEVISTNSWVEISVKSNRGKVQLVARDVQFDYLRGRVEFPIDTPAITLLPDNDVLNHGFSWAHCKTSLRTINETDKAQWQCSVDGFKDDNGKTVSIQKQIEINASDENKETSLFETKSLRLFTSSFHGELSLISEKKSAKTGASDSAEKTLASTDAIHSNSFILSEPHYIVTGNSGLQTEDEINPATVKCERLGEKK